MSLQTSFCYETGRTRFDHEYVDLGNWTGETCFVDIDQCGQGRNLWSVETGEIRKIKVHWIQWYRLLSWYKNETLKVSQRCLIRNVNSFLKMFAGWGRLRLSLRTCYLAVSVMQMLTIDGNKCLNIASCFFLFKFHRIYDAGLDRFISPVWLSLQSFRDHLNTQNMNSVSLF